MSMRIVFPLIVILHLLNAVSALSATPDNKKFAAIMADSSVADVFDTTDIIEGAKIELDEGRAHPFNFILEQSIINYIKNRNGSVYLKPAEKDSVNDELDYTLQYETVYFNLKYDKAGRGAPPGKKVWRKGNLLAIFQLVSVPDGEIILNEEVDIEREDYLTKKEAAGFSGSGGFFLNPELPDGGIKRFVEPIIVGATVATLIFLFFSNR